MSYATTPAPMRATAPAFSLNVIQVASPCSADWAGMAGDDRARHCGECNKNVYNLSAMTEQDALALIREKEGHLCIRFYRREDGTMLTQDCPVGVRAQLRAAWAKSVARVAAVGLLALSFFGLGCKSRGSGSAIGLDPTPTPANGQVMGLMMPPPMPPPPVAPVVPTPEPITTGEDSMITVR